MQWRLTLLCIGVLFEGAANGKEVLDTQVIDSFLNETNPYVYTAVAQRYVAEARAEATSGTFDTRLGFKYDNKQYPVSEGKLTDVFVKKPTESGVEMLFGYRKAEGVQEYNNIKTGSEGEVRLGVRVPVIALVQGMNERTYRFKSATIDAAQSGYTARDNLRQLRFDVFSAYYGLLYRKEAAELESGLLERAKMRESFVQGKVEVGELPEIELLEVKRQILSRKQRLREAENAYEVSSSSFLRFLGLTRQEFEASYELPPLPEASAANVSHQRAFQYALEHRPDLRALEYETDRYGLRDDFIAVEQYPRFDVALYGVHDFEYDNGFKVSLDMDFPIERRKYQGKKREIQKGKRAVEEALQRKRIDIETGLANHLVSLQTLQENLEIAEQEIGIALQLEAAERKKFRLGAGDLILVNQRELSTLEARLKKLSYALRRQLTVLEVQREAGMAIGEPSLNAAEMDE